MAPSRLAEYLRRVVKACEQSGIPPAYVIGHLTFHFHATWKAGCWSVRCDNPQAEALCAIVNAINHRPRDDKPSRSTLLRTLEQGRSVRAQGWFIACPLPEDTARLVGLRQRCAELVAHDAGEAIFILGLAHERDECLVSKQVLLDILRACTRRGSPARRATRSRGLREPRSR